MEGLRKESEWLWRTLSQKSWAQLQGWHQGWHLGILGPGNWLFRKALQAWVSPQHRGEGRHPPLGRFC